MPGTIETDNQMTKDRSEDDVELREVERRRRRNEEILRNLNPSENHARNQTNTTLIRRKDL